MVFGRKKNTPPVNAGAGRMRGRKNADREAGNSPSTDQNPLARRFQFDDEPDTTDLVQPARFPDATEPDTGDAATRVLAGTVVDEAPGADEPLQDPVAGFLVVIEGPGRNSVCHLGYGINSIGRDPTQRISLDYGDVHISRTSHCLVTFDPVSSKFWIQPGEGRALTYLGDQPVLTPGELFGGNHIRIGATVLRFVPLCGPGFSWEPVKATPPGP